MVLAAIVAGAALLLFLWGWFCLGGWVKSDARWRKVSPPKPDIEDEAR